MRNIGKYEYPNLGTFKDALDLAEEMVTKHGGIISNKDAATKLGYSVKNPQRISGVFYEKMKDLSSFGLFEKVRGAYKATSLAEKALHPFAQDEAKEGKIEAIRKIRIIEDAFTNWQGEIPDENAFPAKLAQLAELSWIEAQKHTESLRKLFIEVFPYLKSIQTTTQTSGLMPPVGGRTGGEGDPLERKQKVGDLTISVQAVRFGFTKTLPFTRGGIKELRKLVDFLEGQASDDKKPENENKEKN